MKLPSLRRPSPATAISIVALVVASSGTAYAAVSIGSAEVRNNSLQSQDIKNNDLRSADIKNGSLKKGDFAAGQLPSGARGPAGATGPRGLPGAGRWILINKQGQIEAQSGGFSLVAGYPTLPNTAVPPAPDNSLRANGNVYINANEDLGNNGIVATVVLQNRIDQDGNANTNGRAPLPDANAEFSGEISVSRCGVTDMTPTNCAPAGSQNASSFVVSPRLSDGQVTTGAGTDAAPGTRKAFYVVISGDSTDYVAPPAA